jgi:hypothetical protein
MRIIAELITDTGEPPEKLFANKWDKSDPLAQETNKRNLLAWFGFEETARRLADRNEIQI